MFLQTEATLGVCVRMLERGLVLPNVYLNVTCAIRPVMQEA